MSANFTSIEDDEPVYQNVQSSRNEDRSFYPPSPQPEFADNSLAIMLHSDVNDVEGTVPENSFFKYSGQIT